MDEDSKTYKELYEATLELLSVERLKLASVQEDRAKEKDEMIRCRKELEALQRARLSLLHQGTLLDGSVGEEVDRTPLLSALAGETSEVYSERSEEAGESPNQQGFESYQNMGDRLGSKNEADNQQGTLVDMSCFHPTNPFYQPGAAWSSER